MANELFFENVWLELSRIKFRLDRLEASPPQAGPVQSVVPAAGGGDTPSESGVPAGRETCSIEAIKLEIYGRIAALKESQMEGVNSQRSSPINELYSLLEKIESIEARRRSQDD